MLFSWFWKFTQWSLDFDLPELLAESYKVSFCSWFFINWSANCLLFKTIYLNHIKITWQIHWNLIIYICLLKIWEFISIDCSLLCSQNWFNFCVFSLQGGESLSHDRHAGHWTGTAQLVQVKVRLVRKEIIQGAELLRRRTGRLLLLIFKVWLL